MSNLAILKNIIPAMSDREIDNVRRIESFTIKIEQTEITTSHTLHGGVYSRTIMIPAGVVLTGALIKIPTTLVISGHVLVYVGDKSFELNGYNAFAASANRKQAFIAKTDTYITMVFRTAAKNIEEAENEFTDESALLSSRRPDAINHIVITGE